MNVIFLNLHERDVRRVARFDCGSPDGEYLLQFRSVGRSLTVSYAQALGAHGKRSTRVDNLSLEVANDFEAGLLRHARSLGIEWRSGSTSCADRGRRRRSGIRRGQRCGLGGKAEPGTQKKNRQNKGSSE